MFLRLSRSSAPRRSDNRGTRRASRRSARLGKWIIIAIAIAGWLLRLAPLVRPGGVLAAPIDFDEGVYFSAASLLAKGHAPYVDFVFVHPPGILYLLTPIAMLSDPSAGFAAARLAATIIGGVSILLVGRLALRHLGPVAGVIAALVYATYPQAVAQEHGVFLESFLNVILLLAATLWLAIPVQTRPALSWRCLGAGMLCGLALAVKLIALFAVVGFLASIPRPSLRRHLLEYIAGIALMTVLLWAPVLAVARRSLFHEVFFFQLSRPGDGILGRHARFEALLFRDDGAWAAVTSRHFVPSLLALAGLAFIVSSRARGRLEILAAIWLLAAVAGFMLTSSYYEQYNAFLAPSISLLAGVAAAGLLRQTARVSAAPALTAVVTTALVLASLARLPLTIGEGETRQFEPATLGQSIRTHVPASACIISFEPAWLLAADRLPAVGPDRRFGVDPYGTMLLEQLDRKKDSYDSAPDAFFMQPFDTSLTQALRSCDFVVPGGGIARRVMTPVQRRWLKSAYEPVAGEPSLWRRR